MLASDLEKAKSVAIFAPNQLVIHFLQGYNQAYQNCTDPGRQQRIRDAVHRLTGETWTIRVELVNDPHAVNGAPVTADAASAARPAGSLPLVENLIAALDARLLRTDTGFGALAESAAEPDSAPDEWTGPAEEE